MLPGLPDEVANAVEWIITNNIERGIEGWVFQRFLNCMVALPDEVVEVRHGGLVAVSEPQDLHHGVDAPDELVNLDPPALGGVK